MGKIPILITEPIHPEGIKRLKKHFLIKEKDDVMNGIQAIITRSNTPVGEIFLGNFPKLQLVARAGIGVDGVDLALCQKKDITVINAPTGNAQAASEHTIGLIFNLFRKIIPADKKLREGIWGKNIYTGECLQGKTLGIIGLGRVGSRVAKKVEALGMKVIVYDPFKPKTKKYRFTDLTTLLTHSDVITLHTPLTYWTENFIDQMLLYLTGKNPYLINCARGKIVNERDLIVALKKKTIKGAALDVYAEEPLAHTQFNEMENVVLTPHLGAATVESQKATAEETVKGIENYFFQNKKMNVVTYIDRKDLSWCGFERIIFDVDSTLCCIEGIDELSRMNDKEKEVAELTHLAMGGKIKYEDVFARRLELSQPSRENIKKLGKLYYKTVLPEAKALLKILQALGLEIILFSGSYKLALERLCTDLAIPPKNVYANDLYFDQKGNYRGFNEQNPLCQTGGKRVVANSLSKKTTVVIGDSATDLDAKDVVDLFIGFGGVVQREKIKMAADVYIQKHLLATLPVIIGSSGCERLKETAWKVNLFDSLYYLFQTENIFRNSFQKQIENMKLYFQCS